MRALRLALMRARRKAAPAVLAYFSVGRRTAQQKLSLTSFTYMEASYYAQWRVKVAREQAAARRPRCFLVC